MNEKNQEIIALQERLGFDDIIKKYTEKALVFEREYGKDIQKTVRRILQHCGASSVDDFRSKINNTKEFPHGLMFDGKFGEDYFVRILSSCGGSDARIILQDYFLNVSQRDQHRQISFKELYPENIQTVIKSALLTEDEEKKIAATVWQSSGVKRKHYQEKKPHKGMWVAGQYRGQGLGYAMYRLHDEMFGGQKSEVTAKLSLLKAYIALGYKPIKIFDPRNGQDLDIPVRQAIEEVFQEENEILPFPVYLERPTDNE